MMLFNPMATKLAPWQIAQMRHAAVFWATLPLVVSETFWRTWAEVYRG